MNSSIFVMLLIIGAVVSFSMFVILLVSNQKDRTPDLIVGKLYRINGKDGLFRYVRKNIFRECSSGKVFSVNISNVRKA